MTEPMNLGIDLGRSEARLYDGETLTTIPMLVGGPVATIRRGNARVLDDALESHLSVKQGRMEYSLGRNALEQPFLFPLNDPDLFGEPLNWLPLHALLGLYFRRKKLVGIPKVKLCLGLPVALSRRPDYAASRLQELVKLHSFEFCGQPMSVDVVQVDYLPRPVGAVYAAILSGQLDFSPTENVGVLDAGHATTDWVVVRHPNELSSYSGQSTASAGIRITDAIERYLLEEGISRVNPLAVLEAVSSGQYVDKGDSLPIPSDLTEDLLTLMAQQIALTVKQSWRDLTVDRMILVGAFGRLLYPHLSQYPYFKDLQLAEDHRYYNVKGAYEYAIATPLRGGEPAPVPVAEFIEADA